MTHGENANIFSRLIEIQNNEFLICSNLHLTKWKKKALRSKVKFLVVFFSFSCRMRHIDTWSSEVKRMG